MPTIALFGATGSTGAHILKLALKERYEVQALVRNPSKLQLTNDKLVVIEGDLSNEDAIRKTVTGADYIISVVGNKPGQKTNTDMMTKFVKLLWPILEETKPKMFVYQSGAFARDEKGRLPFMLKFFRYTVGYWLLGLRLSILDNEAATQFMVENPPKNFKFIATRPGSLEETDADVVALEASIDVPEFGKVHFKSLAAFTLQVMKDESLAGKFPFVKIKK